MSKALPRHDTMDLSKVPRHGGSAEGVLDSQQQLAKQFTEDNDFEDDDCFVINKSSTTPVAPVSKPSQPNQMSESERLAQEQQELARKFAEDDDFEDDDCFIAKPAPKPPTVPTNLAQQQQDLAKQFTEDNDFEDDGCFVANTPAPTTSSQPKPQPKPTSGQEHPQQTLGSTAPAGVPIRKITPRPGGGRISPFATILKETDPVPSVQDKVNQESVDQQELARKFKEDDDFEDDDCFVVKPSTQAPPLTTQAPLSNGFKPRQITRFGDRAKTPTFPNPHLQQRSSHESQLQDATNSTTPNSSMDLINLTTNLPNPDGQWNQSVDASFQLNTSQSHSNLLNSSTLSFDPHNIDAFNARVGALSSMNDESLKKMATTRANLEQFHANILQKQQHSIESQNHVKSVITRSTVQLQNLQQLAAKLNLPPAFQDFIDTHLEHNADIIHNTDIFIQNSISRANNLDPLTEPGVFKYVEYHHLPKPNGTPLKSSPNFDDSEDPLVTPTKNTGGKSSEFPTSGLDNDQESSGVIFDLDDIGPSGFSPNRHRSRQQKGPLASNTSPTSDELDVNKPSGQFQPRKVLQNRFRDNFSVGKAKPSTSSTEQALTQQQQQLHAPEQLSQQELAKQFAEDNDFEDDDCFVQNKPTKSTPPHTKLGPKHDTMDLSSVPRLAQQIAQEKSREQQELAKKFAEDNDFEDDDCFVQNKPVPRSLPNPSLELSHQFGDNNDHNNNHNNADLSSSKSNIAVSRLVELDQDDEEDGDDTVILNTGPLYNPNSPFAAFYQPREVDYDTLFANSRHLDVPFDAAEQLVPFSSDDEEDSAAYKAKFAAGASARTFISGFAQSDDGESSEDEEEGQDVDGGDEGDGDKMVSGTTLAPSGSKRRVHFTPTAKNSEKALRLKVLKFVTQDYENYEFIRKHCEKKDGPEDPLATIVPDDTWDDAVDHDENTVESTGFYLDETKSNTHINTSSPLNSHQANIDWGCNPLSSDPRYNQFGDLEGYEGDAYSGMDSVGYPVYHLPPVEDDGDDFDSVAHQAKLMALLFPNEPNNQFLNASASANANAQAQEGNEPEQQQEQEHNNSLFTASADLSRQE